MRRRADVVQLHAQVIYPQGDAVFKGEKWRRRLQLTPVQRGPDSGWRRHRSPQDFLTTQWVANDGRPRQQTIAVGVVAVVVGIDEGADWLLRYAGNRLEVCARPP